MRRAPRAAMFGARRVSRRSAIYLRSAARSKAMTTQSRISPSTCHRPDPLDCSASSNGTIRDIGLIGGSVRGGNFVGALVGYNVGTVNNSYATGAVSGFSLVGGLVGNNQQTITNSYATGAVSGSAGSSDIGGLAGWNLGGTISGSYATGAVSGSSQLGGLVGINLAGTITNSYWDTQTSGQPASGGGSGLTTAQLQGSLPSGFDSAVWGTGSGLYPYLKSFYSGTPQAITGTAYSNGGGTVLSGGTVSALVNGTNLGSVSTGANGYYYVLAPSGTISGSGSAVLAYEAGSGARVATLTGTTTGFDIWGSTLIAPTSATTFSSASATTLQTQDAALIAQARGSNADPTGGLTNFGYIAPGNFTIDTPLTLSNGLYVQSAGNITVADALTLPGANGLTLNATGSLAIDAPISVTGAGKVVLAAANDTTTVPGTPLLELSFAQGDSIDYGATNNGGTLNVNGTAYTLLYSMSDVQAVNSSLNGTYALATSLDATSTSGWAPLGTDGAGNIGNTGNGFAGIFDGLGNTISNLTVNIGTNNYAGLFGYSSGTIRDIGVAGGSTSGHANIGALVGENNGIIGNSYATGGVIGNTIGGGLVGNNTSGTIANSYATGSVVVTGFGDGGGLVGATNGGTIINAYATGAVGGNAIIGGLVGFNLSGTITNAYATGAVTARSDVGGLVGDQQGSVSNAYWDTQTSGTAAGFGFDANAQTVTGQTTAQLQGTLPSGLSSTAWGTGAGLYPYLKWQYPTTPQAISGTAYRNGGGTVLSGGTISALVNGTNLGSSGTGANGYYYLLAPSGTISSNAAVLVYTTGANAGAHIESMPAGSIAGFDVWGNTLIAPTSATTYSAANASSLQTQDAALITSATGTNTAAQTLIAGLTNYGYIATGSDFTIDAPLTLSNGLYVRSAGNITVADALTLSGANALSLNATGSLAINAPVNVSGAGRVELDAGYDTTTVPGASLLELSFGHGDSIDYGATNNGGALSINGAAYTLLYSMSDVHGINATASALGGDYALATSLDATSTSGWAPLGTDGAGGIYNTGNGFAGIFDGLGHTISNLTVNIGANDYAGLFGYSSGTIRNVGVVGGSVSGRFNVGGLVGENNGTIGNSYATGSVSANGSGGGGLVGLNDNGTIANSYATGSISAAGVGYAGGLAGDNSYGTITNAYATGAVSGNSVIGGLVGFNAGTINNAYATGVVGGSSQVGGLSGSNNGGAISNGYWDTQTSGTATGLGFDDNAQTVTGLTTAQMQGTLPSGFSSSAWGTGAGLYPYFKWQYPTAPQAIGGIAYSSGGGTALTGGTVTALVDGNTIGSATTGANGYYYLLSDPGTITSGAAVLAYTGGANGGARVDGATGATLSGFDVWGSTLIAPTRATTYSAASASSLQTRDAALIAQAVGSNTATANLVAGLTNYGYIATGSNFTVNAPLTLSNGLYVQSAGNITVGDALTLSGSNGLTLNAGNGSLAINAPISVTGAGRVDLDASFQPIACGCTTALALSFAPSAHIDYGTTDNGGSLSINGNAYTLLYSMSDMQAHNVSDVETQGNYALATSLDATGVSGWVAFGMDPSGNIFNSGVGYLGTFEGLGNSISHLSVTSINGTAGLFASIGGTVRDLSLSGMSVTGDNLTGGLAAQSIAGTIMNVSVSGTVTGSGSSSSTGGLVGSNAGFIENANADVTVDGADSIGTGGLVGLNIGVVDRSSVTGSVSGTTNAIPIGGVGGLVGVNGGEIASSHANASVTSGDAFQGGGLVGYNLNLGTVENSFATGTVQGGDSSVVGGLVGFNNAGVITQSYATGNVTGGDFHATVGGLVGVNSGDIAQSYATGSAEAGTGGWVGGLVGDNSGIILQSYAMGSAQSGDNDGFFPSVAGGLVGENEDGGVIGESYSTGMAHVSDLTGAAGGFIGNNDSTTPTDVEADYFDTQTSGTTLGIGSGNPGNPVNGVTGQTSAQLRGALPTGFNSSIPNVWATGTGLYPYFLWQYPIAGGTPQAISGFAYSNSGSTPLNAGTVSFLEDGNALGTVSTGPNGFYYLLEAPGTISSGGSAVLAYETGANGGARVDMLTDTATGFDVWGNTLIAPTRATTYSAASASSLQTRDAALIAQAVGANSDPTVGLTNYGYIASGNFAINAPLTLSNGLYVQSAGNITVADALTLSGSNGLTLNAGNGSLAINAPISVTGAGRVELDAQMVPVGCGCVSILALSFGPGDSIDYGSTNNGGSLSINGDAYTLLYSSANVQAVNASDTALQGNYALATSIDATGAPAWTPLGSGGSGGGFDGIFEGLGHAISNLTPGTAVTPGLGETDGMFSASLGTIRDMQLVNVSVNGGVDSFVGGLVGAQADGVVANVTVSGSVTQGGSSGGPAGAGGLAGFNAGFIVNSSSSAAVNVGVDAAGGGLVGFNINSITQSHASGAVTGGSETAVGGLVGANNGDIAQSYATGAATGGDSDSVGGLVGANDGLIKQSYATGAATGGDNGAWVGGLVGDNGGDISQSYATGAAHAGSNGTGQAIVGGLIGENEFGPSTVYESYSTGVVSSSDSGAWVGGFIGNNDDLTAVVDLNADYFDTQTSGTPTGIGHGIPASGVTGETTAALQGGLPAGFDHLVEVWGILPGTSYPYFLWRFPTTPDVVSGTVFTAQGGSAVPGETIKTLVGGSVVGTGSSGANGYYNILLPGGTITTTGVIAYYQDGSHGGGTFEDGLTGAATGLDIYDNLRIITPDANLSTASGNFISTIGDNFGAGVTTLNTFLSTIDSDLLVEANNGTGFSVDQTINGPETVAIKAAGDLTIAHGATVNGNGSGNAVVLSTAGNFINSEGSDAIGVSGGGRWLVYSNAPGGDTFGNLDSANTAIWNATVATLAPGSVTQSGNRYLFAYQPTLTFTTSNVTKTYGADATANVAAAYSVSGIQSGVTGAFLGDTTASVYSGTPSVTSTGSVATAGVSGGPYAIVANTGSLAALNGYTFAFQNNGTLTVNPATLDVTANALSKIYGASDPTLTYGFSGLVAGDTSSVFSGSLTRAAGETVAGGPYAINLGTLSAGSNYTIAYTGANFTITPATLDVTANALSKIYGASDPTLTYNTSGLTNGDTSSVFSGSLVRAAGETVAGGPYAISQGTLSAGSNYTIAYTGANFTIDPATLDVTANALSKIYGASDPTLTYSMSGLTNGDTSSVFSGSLVRAAGETVAGGPYAISQGTLTASSNYTISFTGASFTIDPATLDVTANALSKIYGASDPALTYNYSGLTHGDTSSVISGSLIRAAGETVAGGPYAISQGSLSAGSNYTIAYTGANFTIDPATLDVTANALSKIYGASDPTLTYNYSGLTNGDTSSVFSGSLTRAAGEAVAGGPYAISQGTLSAGSNYTIAYTGANFTIDPATLDVTANALSKIYGASDPTLTYNYSGLTNGDTSSVFSGSLVRAAGETVAGGPYAINEGSLSAGSNYTIAYTGANFTITPATLDVTANALSKIYGASDPTLTFGTSGLTNGDTASVFSGSLVRAPGETVAGGPYAIGQGTLSAGSDYTIAYTGANFTINPATLTALLTGTVEKTYNGTTTATLTVANYDLSGVLGTDVVTLNDPTSGTYDSKNVGTDKTVSVTGLAISGAGASNYVLASASASAAIGIIDPATLTASLTGTVDKTYNGTTTATLTASNYSLSGVIGSDSVSLNDQTLGTYDNKNVGTGKTVTVSGASLTGSDAGNYVLASPSLSAAIGVIDPATLTASLTGTIEKTYDGSTAATLTVSNYSLSGVVGSDSVSLNDPTLGNYDTKNVGTGKTVTVTGVALTGAAAANYVLASTSASGSVGIIDPATLTASLTGTVEKIYNGTTAATLSASNYSLAGVVSGDAVFLNDPTSGLYDNKNAGTGKTVTVTGVALTGTGAGNYTLASNSLSANVGVVDLAALSITADNISAPALVAANPTASYAGFVNGETSSLVSGLQYGLFPVTGTSLQYDIVPFGASAPNYAITYFPGLLTLNPPPPNNITAPLIDNGGYGSLSTFVVTGSFGSISLSNVVTASIGDGSDMLVFQIGLPGYVNPLDSITLTDYSNAVDDNDRLVHSL